MQYQGVVHCVELNRIGLKFDPIRFTYTNGQKVNVRFSFFRTNLRMCHRAVRGAMKAMGAMLFPPNRLPPAPRRPGVLGEPFDSELNIQQREAVEAVICNCPQSPFVLFGPPGTGKTKTLVEMIKQLYFTTQSNLLVCTPSNAAADIFIERLSRGRGPIPGRHLVSLVPLIVFIIYPQFRVNAHGRSLEDVSVTVKAHSQVIESLDRTKVTTTDFPFPQFLQKFRVVISTCLTAARLNGIGIPKCYYSHILIDECGQATEPECCAVLEGLVKFGSTRLVLAGDPQQVFYFLVCFGMPLILAWSNYSIDTCSDFVST